MDRKPAAKPTETAPRPPATPAVTRNQTVDVRVSKARAVAYKETLPGNNVRSEVVRSTSSERTAARRRFAAAAAAEAATAQQRRAECLAARGARPIWTGPTWETEPKNAVSEELSSGVPALGARSPAPQSPSRGRALLETIAARDAAELSQLREALVSETERADEAVAFAASFSDTRRKSQ